MPGILVLLAVTSQFNAEISGDVTSGASPLIINEFMVLPTASTTQLSGQWVEIHNRSQDWVNLSGWTLQNHAGDIHIFGTYMLPPEGYFVLGASPVYNENGGYTPNGVWSDFALSRYGELTLYSPGRDYADMVDWDGSWPVENGASCERINPGWESGISSSWGASQTAFGLGDLGTPGEQNSIYSNSFAQNSWAFIKAFIN